MSQAGGWRERVRARLRSLGRRRLAWGAVAVALVVLVLVVGRRIDPASFHEWTRTLPAGAVVGLNAVLPLTGFPVSVLHLAAGLRFDFWPAMLVVGITTLGHHVAAWALVRVLPARFFAKLDPWREKLAGAGHVEASVLCSLLPGMPYTAQIYLLPVMNVPLRLLCLVSAPLHALRATVTILLGNLGSDLSTGRVVGFAVYYAVIFAGCAVTVRRMRAALERRRKAPDGEESPASARPQPSSEGCSGAGAGESACSQTEP
jgi:uncharacterized membrane protein YdjX (TVP38/TMEM64 family)